MGFGVGFGVGVGVSGVVVGVGVAVLWTTVGVAAGRDGLASATNRDAVVVEEAVPPDDIELTGMQAATAAAYIDIVRAAPRDTLTLVDRTGNDTQLPSNCSEREPTTHAEPTGVTAAPHREVVSSTRWPGCAEGGAIDGLRVRAPVCARRDGWRAFY